MIDHLLAKVPHKAPFLHILSRTMLMGRGEYIERKLLERSS